MPTKNNNLNFNNSYLSLPDFLYSVEEPAKPSAPEMVIFNNALANKLGLSYLTENLNEATQILSGNKIPKQAASIAQAYAGHQFGHFTILGDGRAILLGEHIGPDNTRIDLQLKGAGKTKYSRQGDGLATLYSMLREYLISEAMHNLGVSTTRSLAVVKTGNPVYREYKHEGAVLTRMAASHIRTGTFEFIHQFGSIDDLKDFTTYVINRHFPYIQSHKNPTLELLKIVMEKQIHLIVDWMRVGFIHGVMNTDNMSICGETIDYGPCAFMNNYSPNTVFSSIDQNGRYAFGQQPNVALWNTSVFAQTLVPLIDQSNNKAVDMANEVLQSYELLFQKEWTAMMYKKLGIISPNDKDFELLKQVMTLLTKYQPDYTNFFLAIENEMFTEEIVYSSELFNQWFIQWKQRIQVGQSIQEAKKLMSENNPVVIPRNHLVEESLTKAIEGNFESFKTLLNTLHRPYYRTAEQLTFQNIPKGFDQQYKTYCGT